jgi:hypothetical protein
MDHQLNPLAIGFGEADITPTPPASEPGAFRVFDPIAFRAIVIRQGDENVTLLSGDFFSFENNLLEIAREELRDIAWLKPDHVLASVSHCGGAPILFASYINQPCEHLRAFGQERRFARAAAEAIRAAATDLRPAQIGFQSAPAPGLGYNRRSHGHDGKLVMSNFLFPYPRAELRYGPVDPAVYVLRVDEPTTAGSPARPRGAAIVFGCHALCNTDKAGHVSGDYPHFARGVIGRAWGVPVAFLPGALGNVVPVERGGRAAERVGNGVGGAALYALEQTATEGDVQLKVKQRTVRVPIHAGKELVEAEVALAATAPGSDGNQRFGVVAARRAETEPAEADYTLTRVRLGGTELLHLPGEIFVETAAAIREHSTAERHILLSGPSADVGYLCPPEAFAEGGMEPAYAALEGRAETIIRAAAMELVSETCS